MSQYRFLRGERVSLHKGTCCAVVDETINSLMNGPHSQYFSSEGDKVICTMSDGAKCEVLVSETVDLSDVSQFQPLTNWQSINALYWERRQTSQWNRKTRTLPLRWRQP